MTYETEKIEYKQAFYEFTFDMCDNALMFVDKNGTIIYYNRIMEEMEGLKSDDVCGRTVREVYGSDEFTASVIKMKKPATNVHNLFHSRHGKQIQLLSNYYPVFKEGRFCGVCVISTNQNILQKLLEETYVSLPNTKKNIDLYTFSDIKGESAELKTALRESTLAAQTASNIMVIGETGVGKEVFVQSIHSAGNFNKTPFIPINCSAIPENLLEGLLFGTTKGAFTGAENRTGLVEQAQNGTLYLDELNSMPISLQAKLLRVIQEKKIRRLGGKDSIEVKCRFIASINEDPETAIQNKSLRKDLFYRLSTVTIEIPPLRRRFDDLQILAAYFIDLANQKFCLNVKGIDDELMEVMLLYGWPGNVRELQHVVESAVILSSGSEYLTVDCLNTYNRKVIFSVTRNSDLMSVNNRRAMAKKTLNESLWETEINAVKTALRESGGNITHAAKALGISRQNLNYRLRKLKINHHLQSSSAV